MLACMCKPTPERRKCMFLTYIICALFVSPLIKFTLIVFGAEAWWECENNRKDFSDGCKAGVNTITVFEIFWYGAWNIYYNWVLYHY